MTLISDVTLTPVALTLHFQSHSALTVPEDKRDDLVFTFHPIPVFHCSMKP